MDWIVAGIIVAIAAAPCCPAVELSGGLVLIVYVFNRGLRRVLDYYAGSFNPFSPVSLTPLLVTGLMLLPFLQRIRNGAEGPRRRFFTAFSLRLDMPSS